MIILLAACAPKPLSVELVEDASGLVLRANQPLDRVEVRREGALLTVLQPQERTSTVVVQLPELTALDVTARAGLQQVELPFTPGSTDPIRVWFEVPLGQGRVAEGSAVEVPRGATVRGGLVIEARQDATVHWSVGARADERTLVAGERVVWPFEVQDDVTAAVWTSSFRRSLSLPVQVVEADAIAASLHWDVVFPAAGDGTRDPTAPAGRIVLPAPWWDALLDRLRLGFRARDDQAPRAHLGIRLTNTGERARNVVITAQAGGEHAAAFRNRARDEMQLDRVSRLVRIPAASTVHAALPVYVDRSAIPATLEQPFDIAVQLLGATEPLEIRTTTVVVERGSRWASAVVGVGLALATFGWGLLAFRLHSWLRRSTPELTTIAMFAALSFTVGAASQVLGLGIATVLGPFAPFVLGLGDDAVRMCLLASLITLVPRVGVASIAALVAWLMRAVVLGAVHPVDLLYLGAAVTLSEGCLYAAGITRGAPGSTPFLRWSKLSLGLAVPHAAGVLLALGVSSVVYRLFFAELYVAAVVALPGFLYAVLGCALAVPFVDRVLR